MALASTTAAILAGGLGTRLRSAVAGRPKVLATVGGRPYLEYLLAWLASYSIRDVVLLTGYLGEQVRDELGESFQGIPLRYSQEERPLGTAGSLRHALQLLRTPTILLLNGDSFCDANLASFSRSHQQRGAVSMVLTRMDDASRYGQADVDPDGRITRFNEKGQHGGGWINAGIYFLPRERIAAMPDAGPLSLEREVLPQWADERCLFGFQHCGRFLDIGTPESYAAAEAFLEGELAVAVHGA